MTWRPERPVNLRLTLGPLRRGRGDPTMRIEPDAVWRATRTPLGPATTHLSARGGEVSATAWGPGAEWALDGLPALLGGADDDSGFRPGHPLVRDLHRRLPGLRIGRSAAVVEALVPSVIEQKVTGLEAKRSYAQVVRRFGEPAPGPFPGPSPGGLPLAPGAGPGFHPGLLLPPCPKRLAATPSYVLHPLGLERKRADTIRHACARARRVEEAIAMSLPDARRRLMALPGVGAWTAAEVALVALGDPDAVSIGDYHLANQVAWALVGEPRADDRRMLELLEPWRGHRARVIRLIVAAGIRAPRYGPRMPLNPIAAR